MPATRLPVLLLIVMVALVSACSGDNDAATRGDERSVTATEPDGVDDSTDGVAEPSPTPTPDPEAENALADSLLLSVSDFPTGWSEAPADEADEDNPADACDPGIAPGRTGTAESGDFSRGGAAELRHEVVVFLTPEAAVSSLERFQQIADCLTRVINDGELDTSEAEFSEAKFGPLSFPSLGDASDAYRVEFDVKVKGETGLGSEGTAYIDIIRVIEGRIGFAIKASDVFSPFDTAILETMVRAAHDKLVGAEQ